jgi:hypothetical protein
MKDITKSFKSFFKERLTVCLCIELYIMLYEENNLVNKIIERIECLEILHNICI